MANVQNIVLSGLAHVAVPVVTQAARKELTEREKREKKEAKRGIMRQRKAHELALVSGWKANEQAWTERINTLYDGYGCRGVPGVSARGIQPIYDGMVTSVTGVPWGTSGVAEAKVAYTEDNVVTPYYQPANSGGKRLYVPMPTHQFRRKVSEGETPEAFAKRLEKAASDWVYMGGSFLHGACHCKHCMTYRARAAQQLQSHKVGMGNGQRLRRELEEWDREYNPFAHNYRYRETVRQRYDEDGNPIPRRRPVAARSCPGTSAGVYNDPKAKGGASRLVGLEVEHNRDVVQTRQWCDNWPGAQVIGDGSCGREAVTPPIAGEHIRKCVTELCKALNDGNAGCDSRCGLHVHVDARDMRWADMLRFLTVWCRLESLLFLIGGQNRYSKQSAGGHSYCYAVAELYGKALRSPDPKGAILAAACIGDRPATDGRKLMKDNPPTKKGGGRYKSINIMPWIAGRAQLRADTTVEFRLHRGSHNAERVITWAHICQDIVHWCINATNEDVANLPKSAARALILMSPRNKAWIIKRLLGWRAATTAGRAPIEDDVGNYKPRRIVTMKGGLYLVDATRCSYRRD